MRKYVIMGVQGSGKGTQAMLLAADLDLVHISVGDIFRWNVQHHTKLGAQVRRTMAGGRAGRRRPGGGRRQDPAGRSRLELRVHHRRVPAQRAAGRVLPGELRHRRGDPPRDARQRGAPPGDGPAAVRGLRHGLQPAGQHPAHGRPLRRVRRRAGDQGGRHRGSAGRAAARLPPEDQPGAGHLPAQGVRGHRGRPAGPGHRAEGDQGAARPAAAARHRGQAARSPAPDSAAAGR